jgi:hypothetical protein
VALVPSALSSSLGSGWLVADGGSYPASPAESGDHFAAAVSGWFAAATAGPYPCTTAAARRSQLQAQTAAAFGAQAAPLAAVQLALALMGYMTGQVFGPGVASPPTAVAAGQAAFLAVFADLDAGLNARADQIAQGAYAMAISTIVVFPPVISPPLPVT